MSPEIVFLLDVDNTLIDNDRVKSHLRAEIRSALGEGFDRRFWEVYEDVRSDLDVVSVPVTLERLRQEAQQPALIDRLALRLYSAPFADFVYPSVIGLLGWLRSKGLPVILSDGDPWYQAKKIIDAGLGAAVGGNVLIFSHKQDHIDDIRRWYPAQRYIAVDDKSRLLGLLKQGFGDDLQTIWVRQGHYALEQAEGDWPPPDLSVPTIADTRGAVERLL
jgi:hypothetical protein